MTKLKTTKIKLSAILLMVGMMIAPLAASAATMSLSPTTVNVTQGQSITMTVVVNPQGATIYSAKVEMQYPAELLEFTSFNIGNGWMHIGPDDFNGTGVIRRTAGYPNPGLSSQATFGTFTFLAKESGIGSISITADSKVYDGTLQNVLTSVPVSAVVTIAAPSLTPMTPTTPTVPTVPTTPTTSQAPTTPTSPAEEPSEEGAVLDEQALVTQEPTIAPQSILQSFLSASIGSVITFGTDSILIGLLTVMAILGFVGYVIYVIVRKMRRKNLGKMQ